MSPVYSLVIPIYNEQAVLPLLLRRLDALMDALDGPAEAILVDDGSSDATPIVLEAKARADARYRFIRLSRNFGHQVAITTGMERAAGQAVIVMDADLQDPPEVVLEHGRQVEGRASRSSTPSGSTRDGESRFKRLTAELFYRLLGATERNRHSAQRRRLPPRRPQGARRLPRHAGARPLRARHVRLDRLPPGGGEVPPPAARRRRDQILAGQDAASRGQRRRVVLRRAVARRPVGGARRLVARDRSTACGSSPCGR